MRPMYEIDDDIQAILDNADPETGEINLDVLEALQKEKEEKIEGVLLGYKNAKAEADMLKKIEADYTARRKAAETRAEGLKNYIMAQLDGNPFKTVKVSAYFTTRKVPEYTDEKSIPKKWWNVPEPVLMKKEIGEALKAGQKIPGVQLVEKQSMTIK